MSIGPERVENIANLARLSISDEEKELFGNQLSRILGHIEKLGELQTDDVEPTSHVIDLANVARDDNVRESLSADQALSNTPGRSGDFYRVPKIID
jgi:aspartyl-tRNA(Asn)/glutamyl-tRNA(Gln) amidotransferase subunit C